MGDHDTAHMNVVAASLPAPPGDGALSIHVRVFDEDSFLADGDDQIGDDTFTFSGAEDFGATATTHVRDLGGYRITFSMAKRPPPVIGVARTNPAPASAVPLTSATSARILRSAIAQRADLNRRRLMLVLLWRCDFVPQTKGSPCPRLGTRVLTAENAARSSSAVVRPRSTISAVLA
jgi:hypothetical protein